MNRYYAALLIAAMFLLSLVPVVAHAQALDCTQTPTTNGGFRLECTPKRTATPTRTPAATKTATPTKTPAPPTPTATQAPPTATPLPSATPSPIPPTATPAPLATPAPVTGRIVNVPIVAVPGPDPAYDANNYGITWIGKVVDSTYTDIRLIAGPDGLRIRLQMIDESLTAADAVAVQIGTWQHTISQANPGPFAIAHRCTGDACRGWSATATIPWASFGQAPQAGDAWPMTVTRSPHTWQGSARFGLPDYTHNAAPGATVRTATLAVVADATIGGGTDCGYPDWPAFFPTWGSRNWGDSPYAIAQNQWDIADWPCYAKHALGWSLAGLPRDAEVISATLTMYHFGDPGYGTGQEDDATKTTVFQLFELAPDWTESGIGWDSAAAGENVSRAAVEPIPARCITPDLRFCNPPIPEVFDVAEITRRALVDPTRTTADALIYTAAGQYHSGKQFWSSESDDPPTVRIAYVVPTEPPAATATPTAIPTIPMATATPAPPTATTVPTAGSTPTPQPSATPTATPTRQPNATPTATVQPGTPGKTIYVAPGQTFPWSFLAPGDTLILRDGIYKQSMIPTVNGTAERPITIRAEHDGQAIIDGEGKRAVFETAHSRPGTGNHLIVEGIVGRNSSEDVFFIRSDNVTLRRVSGYNASVDDNSSVFTFWTKGGGLLEDCIASGTGRKMILLYQSDNVTVRRCFTRWQQWDGRDFCGVLWPNAETVQVYNGNGNTFENILATGPSPVWLIAVQSNSDAAVANNNKVLGSIATGAGMNAAGSAYNYGARPTPTDCGDQVRSFDWPNQRAGVMLWGQGTMQNNTFRDILTTGNAALGFSYDRPYGAGATGTVLDRLTAYGNGAYAPAGDGGKGAQVKLNGITATNSCIGAAACSAGGARLTNRYIDGVLTTTPVLPWPMEQRGMDELGISISDIWDSYATR